MNTVGNKIIYTFDIGYALLIISAGPEILVFLQPEELGLHGTTEISTVATTIKAGQKKFHAASPQQDKLPNRNNVFRDTSSTT